MAGGVCRSVNEQLLVAFYDTNLTLSNRPSNLAKGDKDRYTNDRLSNLKFGNLKINTKM